MAVPFPEFSLYVDAELSPAKLPRAKPTPVGLTISAQLQSLTGSIPPALRGFSFESRRGAVDVTGLPVCGFRRLRPVDTDSVMAACRGAIVGRGVGEAIIAYPENSPIPATSDLLVFNGGVDRGVTTLFVRGVIDVPFSKTVIGTMKIENAGEGRYGLSATTKLPALADGYGSVTSFRIHVERRYRYDGVEHSLLTTICEDEMLQANLSATLVDRIGERTELAATLLRACAARSGGAG